MDQIVNDGDFQGNDDQPLGRDAFFAELSEGDVVKAKSDEQGVGCESSLLTARQVEFEIDDGVVGTVHGNGNDDNRAQISGVPSEVSASTFVLNGQTITVTGSTLIDDSIIEAALGSEFNGGDRRFDQLPGGLGLQDLLSGGFAVGVVVDADGIALSIEDL